MNRLVYFLLSLPVLLAFITSADAGPACARRSQGTDACIRKCRDKWGWPGHVMGTDRWGQVITKTVTDDMGAVVTQACRVRPSGLGSAKAATTTIASSTSPLLVPPPSSSVPANVIVSASVSSVVSAAPSVSLLPLTHTNSTSKKASFSAFVASTTAPASSFAKPSTTAAPPTTSAKPSTTTHATTSHTEAPPPPPPTTTKKTSSEQPKATQNSSSGQSQGNGNNGSNNGNSGSSGSSNNNGNSGNSGATSQSDIDQYLQAHNSVRAQHGAAPLSWSDDLAAKAQQWANNCVFQHSGGKLGPFGENLAAGTGSSYGIQEAVKSWTDEVSEYDPNNPQPSHFTQVVWKASTQVGCAVQSCNGIFDPKFGPAKFFVCEYSPQGNVIGQFAQNVQA
ncbi:PR-1-like protein [Trametes cingulata]|nr:PR-1-like protein [Trametes cingulata]